MKDISLYIHIPFCESKCYYRDFTSFVGINHRVDAYINALINELKLYKEKLEAYNIKTIFIGGGTPSSIDGKYIYRVLEYIYGNFNCSGLKEVTIESNPGSLSPEKMSIYRQAGINRISMGGQTFDDKLLKLIGRAHSSKQIYESIYGLREAGFKNINLDLMAGLPNQTMASHMDSLEKALDLDLEHISNYSLILEEGTPLFKDFQEGRMDILSDEEDRDMYHKTIDYLTSNGYTHYEISNYAKPGFESLHNLTYWNIGEYLGLGLGSHSNLAGRRFNNGSNLPAYIDSLTNDNPYIEDIQIIGEKEEISEYCIMGFRKIRGINKGDFKKRFGQDIGILYKKEIEKHIGNGLLNDGGENIYLTPKGLDLLNLVEVDFFR